MENRIYKSEEGGAYSYRAYPDDRAGGLLTQYNNPLTTTVTYRILYYLLIQTLSMRVPLQFVVKMQCLYSLHCSSMRNQVLGVKVYVNIIRTHSLCLSLVIAGLLKMTSDREALLALHRATGGPQWRNNGGWDTDNDISLWCGTRLNCNNPGCLHRSSQKSLFFSHEFFRWP